MTSTQPPSNDLPSLKPHSASPDAPAEHQGVAILKVATTAPFHWISAAMHDLRLNPAHALLYGALFTGACWLTYALSMGLPWFTVAFITGLLLIGPYLATGAYLAARQHEAGKPVSIRAAVAMLRARKTNMALYAIIMALIMAA